MIDWKRKLTSRKFWMAVVGLVAGIMVAFGTDAETVETVSGIIMSGAAVVAYIIGEGLADAASMSGVELELIEEVEEAKEAEAQ